MKRSQRLLFAIIIQLAFPALALAESPSSASRSYGGAGVWASLLMLWICSRYKKKEIGGWLLYYYIQLYIGTVVMVITTLVSLNNLNPGLWEDNTLYILFLVSSIPGTILFMAQTIIATMALKKRDFRWITRLKYVLAADILFVLFAMLIDFRYFPDNLWLNVLGLIWPSIWLPYFMRSRRVQHVFNTKDWSPEIFSSINEIQTDPKVKQLNELIKDIPADFVISCYYCGQKIAGDSESCPLCNTNVPDNMRKERKKICPYCAEEIKFKAIKCKHCGSTLEATTA